MVKIVEKTLEERASEQIFKELVNLTRNLVGVRTIRTMGTFGIDIGSHISVDLLKRYIYVKVPEELAMALTLAKAYEDRFRDQSQEFTLKKEY